MLLYDLTRTYRQAVKHREETYLPTDGYRLSLSLQCYHAAIGDFKALTDTMHPPSLVSPERMLQMTAKLLEHKDPADTGDLLAEAGKLLETITEGPPATTTTKPAQRPGYSRRPEMLPVLEEVLRQALAAEPQPTNQ